MGHYDIESTGWERNSSGNTNDDKMCAKVMAGEKRATDVQYCLEMCVFLFLLLEKFSKNTFQKTKRIEIEKRRCSLLKKWQHSVVKLPLLYTHFGSPQLAKHFLTIELFDFYPVFFLSRWRQLVLWRGRISWAGRRLWILSMILSSCD